MSDEKIFHRSEYEWQEFLVTLFCWLVFFPVMIFISVDDRLSFRLMSGGLLLGMAVLILAGQFMGHGAYMKLDDEAVEWGRPGKMRRLRRADVLGWGVKTGRSQVNHIELRTREGERVVLAVHLFAGAQTALTEWLAGLPDLDATDDVFRNRALMNNAAFGPPEVREAQIHNHKAFLGVMSGLSGMVAVWTLISGYAPVRVIAVIIPLLVCVLPAFSGGRWSFLGRQRTTLPVWHIAVWPIVTTALVAYFIFEPADEAKILLMASGAAVGLLVVQKLVDRRVMSWLVLPVNLIYVFSALTLANGAYETAPRQHFETEVQGKTSGRYSGGFVRVEPWGPVTQVRKLRISTSSYRKTQLGDTLCMTLYTGALGWQYYDWALCKPKAPTAAP